MHRPGKFFTHWLLAVFSVCILLAWTLHKAEHAAEPVLAPVLAQAGEPAGFGAVLAALDADVNVDEDTDADPHGSDEPTKPECPWCLFHADHAAASGAPAHLLCHAESSLPARRLERGLPAGRCTLAAPPRGPPATLHA